MSFSKYVLTVPEDRGILFLRNFGPHPLSTPNGVIPKYERFTRIGTVVAKQVGMLPTVVPRLTVIPRWFSRGGVFNLLAPELFFKF
jgi:hypothetical protein